MASKREMILDNIYTDLAGITTANGYTYTPYEIGRSIKAPEDCDQSQTVPFIGFAPFNERFAFGACNQVQRWIDIYIAAYITASSEADRTEKLGYLLDDILKALMADIHRGASAPAVHTIIVDAQTDEYDPAATHNNVITGSLLIRAEVYYITEWS